MVMWKRNLTATALAFATTVAFAAAQDYQIVKVASVAGAAIDGLKPKTIFFTDHRIDETSDKGAFIRFGEEGFEGLLPSRRLRGWWTLNELGTALEHEESGRRLRLGDAVEVTVDRVETARGRVDLSPADAYS